MFYLGWRSLHFSPLCHCNVTILSAWAQQGLHLCSGLWSVTILLGLSGITWLFWGAPDWGGKKGTILNSSGKTMNSLVLSVFMWKLTCKWAVFNWLKGNWVLTYILGNIKETHQNTTCVLVIWEILNIEFISDLGASLSLWI